MQISSTLGLSSILDYMDSDNDNSIESVLTANSNYRTAILKQKLSGISSSSSDIAKAILNAADSASSSLDSLLNDTSEDAVADVQKFVSSYNAMVKNMSSQGGRINVAYLVELGKAFVDNEGKLAAIGITRSENGQLVVDTDKLKSSSLDSIKAAFSGDDSYASRISTDLASITKVTTATSAMSGTAYSQNYSSAATISDSTQSLMDSLFNSKA